jgi:hypothetical protein
VSARRRPDPALPRDPFGRRETKPPPARLDFLFAKDAGPSPQMHESHASTPLTEAPALAAPPPLEPPPPVEPTPAPFAADAAFTDRHANPHAGRADRPATSTNAAGLHAKRAAPHGAPAARGYGALYLPRPVATLIEVAAILVLGFVGVMYRKLGSRSETSAV